MIGIAATILTSTAIMIAGTTIITSGTITKTALGACIGNSGIARLSDSTRHRYASANDIGLGVTITQTPC